MIAALVAALLLQGPATGCPVLREGGKIVRSPAAVRAFRATHPCPTTGKRSGACPGYVVDHLWPLCAGGCDDPSNMQWQARAPSLRKDRLERRACVRPGEAAP
jgi:hypothetical protein